MYLYKTVIYHDTSGVVTVPENNFTSNADFVNNNKATAVKVDELAISATTFITELTYAGFDNLVTQNTTWASVKYIEGTKSYLMFLISTNPL